MKNDEIVILSLADAYASGHRLHQRFVAAYDSVRIVLDLSGTDMVDATFLSELAQLRVYRSERGLQLGRLVVESPYVRNALSAVGFDRNWPMFRTLQDAVASFDGPPLYA